MTRTDRNPDVPPAGPVGALGAADAAWWPSTDPIDRILLPMTARVSEGGRLQVGGVDVLSLAEEYGTPLFVYDEEHLRTRCREAVTAWGEGVAYATKAFLCRAMARLACEEGMDLDVSTGGELHVALAAGVPAGSLVLHGSNKSQGELVAALAAGVGRIVVDSFDELDRLAALTSTRTDRTAQRILLRVTPGVEAHTHEFVRTGHEDTKFGFSLASGAAQRAVVRARSIPGLRLVGIHAHIGSQVFEVSSLEQSAEIIAGFFEQLKAAAATSPGGTGGPTDSGRLEELCVGGGLGVPYVNGERAPTMTEWAQATRAACARMGIAAGTRITAEPGRSIVATAGMTLYRVGTVKELPGIRTYVSVDGGMSDNPRPVLYGSGYEAFLPRAVDAPRPRAVRVVGKHCESGDVVVASGQVPADLAVGDVLATPVTGAYGHSMASNYNKVPRPSVVFVSGGRARVVVRRETLDDLLRLDA